MTFFSSVDDYPRKALKVLAIAGSGIWHIAHGLCVYAAGRDGLTNSRNKIPESQSQGPHAFRYRRVHGVRRQRRRAWALACAV